MIPYANVCPTCRRGLMMDVPRYRAWCAVCRKVYDKQCVPHEFGEGEVLTATPNCLFQAMCSELAYLRTQKAMAAKMKIPTSELCNVLNGNTNVSRRILDYYGLSKEILFRPNMEVGR